MGCCHAVRVVFVLTFGLGWGLWALSGCEAGLIRDGGGCSLGVSGPAFLVGRGVRVAVVGSSGAHGTAPWHFRVWG
jgi:hypothetical protein